MAAQEEPTIIADLHARASGAPLLRKFGYNVSVGPPVLSLGLGGKKTRRVGKGVPDMYVAIRFWRKI